MPVKLTRGKSDSRKKIQPAATEWRDGLLFPPEQSFDALKVTNRLIRARGNFTFF
jgi:hypothetical protein